MWQAGANLHRGARASHHRGLSCCRAQAPDAQAQHLWLTGLAAPQHVGSSRTRDRTRVPCIGRQILNHCVTREALFHFEDTLRGSLQLAWLGCVPTPIVRQVGPLGWAAPFRATWFELWGRTVSQRWGVLIRRGERWRADEAGGPQGRVFSPMFVLRS